MNKHLITHGLSGLGPRNLQYLLNLALLLETKASDLGKLQERGIDFSIHVTVYEKNVVAGAGNAFQPDCDASVNTGITPLPNLEDLDHVSPVLKSYADLASTVAAETKGRVNAIMNDLKLRNPVAAVLFKSALDDDGNLNTRVANMTRGRWGRIQYGNGVKFLDYIKKHIPRLEVVVHYQHEVMEVDIENPKRPVLVVRKLGDRDTTRHEFDYVTLAHGTPLVSPVSDVVAPLAYSKTPNHDTMREYLASRGCLGDDGYLKPDVKLLVTGMGLSSYDYGTLLLAFLPPFQVADDASGFSFDREKAALYQGVITFVSRNSPRGPSPPRIAPDQTWVGAPPLINTEEMHAIRLHSKINWLAISNELTEASVARSRNVTPKQLNAPATVYQHMAQYHAETTDSLAGGRGSTTDLRRAAFVAASVGSGLESRPAEAEERLQEKAPFTRAGYMGWPMFDSAGIELSTEAMTDTPANAAFFDLWATLHHFIAASPQVLQHAMSSLFVFGIATHVAASFNDISASDSGAITLFGKSYDALLAPRSIVREADTVVQKLSNKVKVVVPGVPQYGKGHCLLTNDDEPVHVFDVGMGSWGTMVRAEDGTSFTIGQQAWETNNHSAGGSWAMDHARLSLLLAVIAASVPADADNAMNTVNSLFDEMQPSVADFNAETAKFAPVWLNLQEKLVFVRICETLADGNGALYREFTDKAFTKEARDAFIREQRPEIVDDYFRSIDKLVKFDPPRLGQFNRRFVSYTRPQLIEMWHALLAKICGDDE